MSDGSADPVDWAQFYESMASGRRNRPPQSFTDVTSTLITDTAARSAMAPISIDMAAAGGSRAKPARKRSRTSRRAPTTLLNTDTSNFRAMVQQFTGVPSVPYAASYMPGGGATTLNFGVGFNNPFRQSTILPSFGLLETRQNQHQYQQQEERYMLPPQEEMIGFGIGGHVEDGRRQVGLGLPEEFFQANPRQSSENNRGAAGYFL